MTAGDTVITKFGMGIITALIDDDQIAVVDFERAGIRMCAWIWLHWRKSDNLGAWC